MTQPTIVLIDGHSLFHRAFFALPPLTNRHGQQTNAVFGFLTMLFKLIDQENPACLAVVFDKATPTFRHETFEKYKAHRPETADELRSQMPLLRQALEALRVPVFEKDGYEADDVLGHLAERAAAQGWRVLLVSGDRDLLQLARPGVGILLTRKGISELEYFDEAAVLERYSVSPRQLIDVKALMGDPSDNIPGVPGIGEKTALKLIREFGSLEGLYARLDELRGKKVGETLVAHREAAELSKRLATIVTDVPLEVDLEACRRREPDQAALRRVFTELGFKSLLKRFDLDKPVPAAAGVPPDGGEAAPGEPAAGGVEVLDSRDALHRAAQGVSAAGRIVLAAGFAAGGRAEITGLAVDWPGGGKARVWTAGVGPAAAEVLTVFRPVLADAGIAKSGHDLKPLWRFLRRNGIEAAGLAFDTALAAYLLEPTRSGYPLEYLVEKHLGSALPPAAGAGDEGLGLRLAHYTAAVSRLCEPMRAELEAAGLVRLYEDIELPLVAVLASMEAAGVLVDPAVLDELGQEFVARTKELAEEIYGMAGTVFNINSPQQLGEVLFGRLGLPRGRKTKTGWSTDAAVLESLAAEHPIAARVLEYRHLVKLHGTYVVGLRHMIDPETGRVHTTFNQMVTATGRLSSTEPNLQNIPVRESLGRRLRRAFVAPPGAVLLSADYSQIELRVLAHISGDPALIHAFREGADIHRATAAEVFGVPREAVTREMRDAAKAVNFGIVYGISDFGLARNLGIPQREAGAFIERYLDRFPGVRAYMHDIVERARREGLVRTLFNRLRHLPEIDSKNPARRRFAERTALNTPIQGTAADIIKLAMVRVHSELTRQRMRSRLILQVHDELILEIPEDELPQARELVVRQMEGVADLAVPLQVEAKAGSNWFDMQPV